ncbi:hypothetical protein JYQ62_05945 [Nostoc sp. UHCC 0702]|nr:hypothetical protein JYQ62_05945 [Nostoc sp. UHCC 0702]
MAIPIDGFKDNNGDYFLSQSQVAEAVGVQEYLIRQFLTSKRAESLLGAAFGFDNLEVEEGDTVRGGCRQVKAIPPKVASLFWSDQAQKGNRK